MEFITENLIPKEVMEKSNEATGQLIPKKSSGRYEKEFDLFNQWKQDNKVASINEDIVMAYLYDLFVLQSKKYKSSSLWSKFSMVKSMLLVNENINIAEYAKVRAFLKKQSVGYEPSKSKVLSRKEIDRFMSEAPNKEYLMMKSVLREEFSKFGNVLKIFVDADLTYAKVYLDDLENLKLACNQLNGLKSWKTQLFKDDYKGNQIKTYDQGLNNSYESSINSFVARSRTSLNRSFGASSNGDGKDMEEECMFAGDYVDVHGRSVEVLQGENGVMYVNLDDIRTAGYNIYKKESFENATITKDIELRALENYLLNQARKYCLESKKNFNEDEMLGVFERIEAKLQNKSGGEFGEGRIINASPNTRNFTITKSNVSTPAADYRSPRELPENFQPTFSHIKAKPKAQQHRFDERQDQQNRFDDGQDRRNGPSSNTSSRRSYDDRNNRQGNRNEEKRKPLENNLSFTEFNQIQHSVRKPRQNNENMEVQKNIRSKALADNNAKEEPEETWEGTKTIVPKSKPRNDSASVTSERRNNINIERTLLTPTKIYTMKVSYVKPDKNSLFYGQNVEDLNQIEEILLHVNTKDLELPDIVAPVRDMLCIVHYVDCWYRAVVLNEKQAGGGCYVELIDYGNKEIIRSPLKEMSPEMKKIPGMAIRVAVHNGHDDESFQIETEQEIEVFVRKHYDDLTHLVEIKQILNAPKLDQESPTPPSEISSDQELPPPPKTKTDDKPAPDASEDCFMEIPSSTVKLTNGESVMIVSYTDTKFILRNKEAAMKCKELYTHMDNVEKKPILNPKVGQLVLCSKDGSNNLHRAVIKKINNQVAELEYLDHYGGESLSLKSLKHIDKLSVVYPVTKLESPDVKWLKKVTEKSDDFILNLVMKKTKLKVVLDGPNFDLLLSEGGKDILLSAKIEQLENPPKEVVEKTVSTPGPSKSEEVPIAQPTPNKETPSAVEAATSNDQFIKIDYNQMPFAKAEIGENEYVCYNCKEGLVTLLLSSEAAEYLKDIVIIETTDTVPFQPAQCEMCLCKFDEVWYRAVLLETQEETCQVIFVDFGNSELVSKTDIRKFPKELATIPILGINAYFMGVPDTPEVQQRLQELIPDETELNVVIKTDMDEESLKYGIEIPSVYKVLKEENLI